MASESVINSLTYAAFTHGLASYNLSADKVWQLTLYGRHDASRRFVHLLERYNNTALTSNTDTTLL